MGEIKGKGKGKRGAFTDYQVQTLVRDHPGANLYQLLGHARRDMPRFDWSVGKIQKAIERLKREKILRGRIKLNGARACQQLYLR
jgi:hypothetical protein